MTNTKAKLEFVWAMARHTRATVRQCEALMRYAGTLARQWDKMSHVNGVRRMSVAELAKWNRIERKAILLVKDIGLDTDVPGRLREPGESCRLSLDGPRMSIRVPSGEGIMVPS
jgi:hypothetical protein